LGAAHADVGLLAGLLFATGNLDIGGKDNDVDVNIELPKAPAMPEGEIKPN